MSKLPKVLSGRAFGQAPTRAAATLQGPDAVVEFETVSKYYGRTHLGAENQPLWRNARIAVNRYFVGTHWHKRRKELLTSVIALMATTPIETRGKGDFGLLLAKTDFAKILELTAAEIGREIPYRKFLRALVDTINSFLDVADRVTENSDVFPAGFGANGVALNGLTLKRWVLQALPVLDPLVDDQVEFIQGTDMLTSKHFPGTQQQKKEARAWGTFGSKTDAGNKVILEWRSFHAVIPDQLESAMLQLADYLGQRVNR